jgi:hypothetical protein
MATNAVVIGHGSYTVGSKPNQEKHDFQIKVEVLTEDEAGLELAVADYGASGVVSKLNKISVTRAVNEERTRLTADRGSAVKEKASVFDLIKAARTPEEKQALLKQHGLI